MTKPFVDILVPVALDQTYSYRVPKEFDLKPGDIVTVPLGAREAIGVVWADDVDVRPGLHNRLKDVDFKLDYPPLKPDLRKFVDWVSGYTLSPRGMVLRMCLRMGNDLGPAREKVGVRIAGPAPKRMTTARMRVLQLLSDGLVRTKSEAAHEASVSAGVIDGLVDEGALETLVLPPEPVARQPDPDFAVPEFTDAQRKAADALRTSVDMGGFSVTLVDGVTGSGKTEVYFEAVAQAIRHGRQVLILMPEIALTAQFLDRFAARFGVRPAEWHSVRLTSRLKAATLRRNFLPIRPYVRAFTPAGRSLHNRLLSGSRLPPDRVRPRAGGDRTAAAAAPPEQRQQPARRRQRNLARRGDGPVRHLDRAGGPAP